MLITPKMVGVNWFLCPDIWWFYTGWIKGILLRLNNAAAEIKYKHIYPYVPQIIGAEVAV